MSAYLKTLGLHVYLATIKKSYIGNDKYLEANTQALHALRQKLSKDHLSIVFIAISLLQYGTYRSLQRNKFHTMLRENLL